MAAGPQRQRNAGRAARPVAEDDVGPRLRAHREQRQLSLREARPPGRASRRALSPRSRPESPARPSARSTRSSASSGYSLDELFGGHQPPRRAAGRPPKAQAAAKARPAGRARRARLGPGAAERERDTGSTCRAVSGGERLTAQPDAEADFLYVVYDVGGSSSQDDLSCATPGASTAWCSAARSRSPWGSRPTRSCPGDSISFDSTIPHRLRNTGSKPVTGVWLVIGRAGDDRNRGLAGRPAD